MSELLNFTELMKLETCTYCGSEPGDWCRSKSGRRLYYMHSARFYAAKESERQKGS